jgi:hypothetical protein
MNGSTDYVEYMEDDSRCDTTIKASQQIDQHIRSIQDRRLIMASL